MNNETDQTLDSNTSERGKSGPRWQSGASLVFLVGAILLGLPAVGSHDFLEFLPFIVAAAVGLGIALNGLNRGTLWNRFGSGVSLLLLLAISACMVLAATFREPP